MSGTAVRDLLVATTSQGKLKEMRDAFGGLPFKILTLADLGKEAPEVVEDGETLLENAQIKARAYARFSGLLTLADDSGLEVDALDGAPGVFSARWSGGGPEENNKKLLAELAARAEAPRTAVFRTVLVVAEPGGREDWVAGSAQGVVPLKPQGTEGFGYDPLFFVPKAGKTFAQMTAEEKNRFSHRGEALRRARKLLERW